MTLIQLVSVLAAIDGNQIIFAEANPAWNTASRVVLGSLESDDPLLVEKDGLPYFLEVYLAQEVLEVWSEWRNGAVPTDEEKVAALVYYATRDAYQPVEHE